jgi:predicted HNH restriction endonuclease
MLPTDDNGQVLHAEYVVEQDEDKLALILESAGGAAASRPARNKDYRPALALILARLRDLDAVIQEAFVDTRTTQRRGITEDQRKLIESPIRLADELDIEAVRLRLTSAQARIGQAPTTAKGGNSSKRIRLRLEVPGFRPDEADRLATTISVSTGRDIFHSPEEAPEGQTFPEGAVTRVEVNRYERDPRARRLCLAYWGPRCAVCALDFGTRYGALGSGFIHVHHTLELSSVGPGYQVDPVSDLRPVCPNCHAMLHRRRPALSINELIALMPKTGDTGGVASDQNATRGTYAG